MSNSWAHVSNSILYLDWHLLIEQKTTKSFNYFCAILYDDEAVMQIPREQFAQLEEEAALEVGMQLVAQMPHGPSPFTITLLSDDTVTADFNHALAGQSLTFAVEIVDLREATEDEQSHGHAHGADGQHQH